MPVPKKRHQRESPSGEPKRTEDSPEPKRHQRETTSPGFPVTQDQPAAAAIQFSAAVISDPPSTPSLLSQLVQPDPFRRIYEEMPLNIRATREAPASDEGSPSNTRGGHAPSGSNHQPRDGTATGPPHNRAEGVEAASSASTAGGIWYPPPPDRPPPPPPSAERSNFGSATFPQQGPPSQSPPPGPPARLSPVEDFALWGGLSEAEIRRQVSLLEAMERRRRGSFSPSPGPLLPSIISPLTSPPLSPPLVASRSNKLGPPPLPPGASPLDLAQSRSTHQVPVFTPVSSAPSPRISRLGLPPLPPTHQTRETLPGSQHPRLIGLSPPRHAIRPEIVSASSFTRHSDRASSLEGSRPRRGAMSIYFDDDPDIQGPETRRLYTTMRGSPNQAFVDLIRDSEAARATGAYWFQHGLGPIPPNNMSDDNLGSLQQPMPHLTAKRAKSEPKKGSTAAPSRSSSSAHDSTFRFLASKGYYEAVVPMAYVMNNPNTRPLSTTDPFFRCFPSDPDEIPFIRGTRLATRPPTPETHLDETPEQKKEHLKQVKETQRKQDRTSRKDVSLPLLWHLQYSNHPRTVVSSKHTLSGSPSGSSISQDDLADEAEFQEHLAKIEKEYRKRMRALKIEGEAANSMLGYIPIDELAIDPLVSSRSRRTAQPEEAQPLEVGREPEHVQGPSSEPSSEPSSRNAPEEETGESSQGRKKESRTRK